MSEESRINIIVVGKTGVGKSTLINSFFGKDLARADMGGPVTERIQLYESNDSAARVYDTAGLEMDEDRRKASLTEIRSLISRCAASNPPDRIHCVWFCINPGGSRLEPMEEDLLKEFTSETALNVPVIVVLTQYKNKQQTRDFADWIRARNIDGVRCVVPVLAQDIEMETDNGLIRIEAFGLEELLQQTKECVPEANQRALAAAQKVSFAEKESAANKAVLAGTVAAAVAGAVPIPFADAAVLIPVQVGMLISITAIFNLPVKEAALKLLASAAIGPALATITGRAIVANILKCIPVVGTITGGAISAGTAAALTTAIGKAYIKLAKDAVAGKIDITSPDAAERMKELVAS